MSSGPKPCRNSARLRAAEMRYLLTHLDDAWALTVIHLRLSLVPVGLGLVIGIGGLGTWFTEGYQSDKSDQIIAGIIAIFVLAVVIDTLIMFGGRLLTPWTRATGTGRVKATAAA